MACLMGLVKHNERGKDVPIYEGRDFKVANFIFTLKNILMGVAR